MELMADIGNSLNQGAEFARGLAADERKTAAYNALSNAYGVALAGDPDTTIKAQEFQQREQTNPIAVQQAQATLAGTGLENTGKAQENDFNALANPKKLTGLDLTNTGTEATTAQTKANTTRTNALLPGEVAQQGATLAGTRAQTGLTGAETAHANVETQQGKLALNTAEAAQQRTSAMGILASLSDTASAGGDIGAQFDKLAPLIAKYEGVDPSHLPQLREALVRDPVGTINQLSTGIQAANLAAQGAGGKSTAGALNMMKFSAGQMSLKDGLNFTAQRTGAVPDLVNQMAALAKPGAMSTIATVRVAKAHIPGTPEYQFQALVEQLKPNLSLDDLRNLKASGMSMGRITNQEMSMAGNAVANMDLGQDLSTLSANLKRIGTTYDIVNKDLQAQIARIGSGGGMPGVPHATQPKAAQFQEGVVYTDAQGNKAAYRGGKFVPVQ
jgi:hypothetical protein